MSALSLAKVPGLKNMAKVRCAADAARQQGQASRPSRHRGGGRSPTGKPEVPPRPTVPRTSAATTDCVRLPVMPAFSLRATAALNPPLLPTVPSALASLWLLSLAHSFLSHYPAFIHPFIVLHFLVSV